MYEMASDGSSEYTSRTLRDLLNYVNSEAKTIDFGSREEAHEVEGQDIIEHSAVSELRLRDLRRLDYQFNPNEEKSVLVRRHAVLFAMDPLRAVVMANRLILIVPDGADSLITILDQYMKEWNGEDKKIAFEAHAYEALLTTIKALETQEFTSINKTVQDVLSYFKTGSLLPIEIQEKTRKLKNFLSIMCSRVHTSINVLQDLTEDDEEMALMNLTFLGKKPKLYT